MADKHASHADHGSNGSSAHDARHQASLANWDILDNEFEISAIEADAPFFIREVRRKIQDKLDHFAKILGAILDPDTTMPDMHECKEFTEKDRTEIMAAYKRIMALRKDAYLLDVDSTDDKEVSFIAHVLADYADIKHVMAVAILKTKNAWTRAAAAQERVGYLG